jgi:hypothetical protein
MDCGGGFKEDEWERRWRPPCFTNCISKDLVSWCCKSYDSAGCHEQKVLQYLLCFA